MDKITEFFKQWDKSAHAFVSMTIMLVFTAIGSIFLNSWVATGLGTIICLLCGVGKEFLDSKVGKVCSIKDFYADLIGWGIAAISLIVFNI